MQARLSSFAFAFARFSIGVYSFIFFYQMLQFPESLLGLQKLEFLKIPLPPFHWAIGKIDLRPVLLIACGASVLLALGILRRWMGAVLWLSLVFVICHNSLIREIQFDYLGWLFLLFAFVPSGEPGTLIPKEKPGWAFPRAFYFATLTCFGASYTLSGLSKITSAEWNNGEMLEAYFAIGFGLGDFGAWGAAQPRSVLAVLSYFVAITELIALPLLSFSRTRPWIWAALTLGQIVMVISSRVNHISILLVFFHLLLINEEWWKSGNHRAAA